MTDIEYMYEQLKTIKNKTPLLIIGKRAMYIFKQMYKGNIYILENLSDVRDFISEFADVELSLPVVIEDLSNLYRDSSLLKLVEDSKFPLVMLASQDNLSHAMMSRVKTIVKLPDENYRCNFSNIESTLAELKEKELSQEENIKYLAENCPQLLFLQDKIKKMKNKDKITQIYSGIEKMISK